MNISIAEIISYNIGYISSEWWLCQNPLSKVQFINVKSSFGLSAGAMASSYTPAGLTAVANAENSLQRKWMKILFWKVGQWM